MKPSSQLTGVAGEYFVAAELSRRGFIASITMRNTRGIDILATNSEAKRAVTIQCKTSRDKNKSWIVRDKSEDFVSEAHFYVFVKLRTELERPDYYIVPSNVVAHYISTTHREWLKGKKASGGQRKDTAMRKFSDSEDKYLEKWDLLGL
jgi:hypothetical protein